MRTFNYLSTRSFAELVALSLRFLAAGLYFEFIAMQEAGVLLRAYAGRFGHAAVFALEPAAQSCSTTRLTLS